MKKKKKKPKQVERKKRIYGAILRKLRIKIFQEERENIVSLKQEQSPVFFFFLKKYNQRIKQNTQIKEYGS